MSIVGCIMFAVSIKQKTQKRISIIQTVECLITATTVVLAGAIVGSITTYLCALRNFLSIWNKNHKYFSFIMIGVVFVVTLLNWASIWDIFPFVATSVYTIMLSFHSVKLTKIAIIPNCICWFVYDFHYGMYVYCIFNAINIGLCIYDIARKRYED